MSNAVFGDIFVASQLEETTIELSKEVVSDVSTVN